MAPNHYINDKATILLYTGLQLGLIRWGRRSLCGACRKKGRTECARTHSLQKTRSLDIVLRKIHRIHRFVRLTKKKMSFSVHRIRPELVHTFVYAHDPSQPESHAGKIDESVYRWPWDIYIQKLINTRNLLRDHTQANTIPQTIEWKVVCMRNHSTSGYIIQHSVTHSAKSVHLEIPLKRIRWSLWINEELVCYLTQWNNQADRGRHTEHSERIPLERIFKHFDKEEQDRCSHIKGSITLRIFQSQIVTVGILRLPRQNQRRVPIDCRARHRTYRH